jgi:hypothetical protein
MNKQIKAEKLISIFRKIVELWHKKEKKIKSLNDALCVLDFGKDIFEKLISEISIINSYLWHEEDKARSASLSDSRIAEVKHNIDYANQKRNDKIEEIDRYMINLLATLKIKTSSKTRLNSETPGSVIDRLSILTLKIYHMKEQTLRKDASAEHKNKYKTRLSVLCEQKKDLSKCFNELMNDLIKGRKKLRIYYQFKMYNDPSTNPWMKG